jgi:hypothetical protein
LEKDVEEELKRGNWRDCGGEKEEDNDEEEDEE